MTTEPLRPINYEMAKCVGSAVHAVAVVIGFFAPGWLVALLAIGWLFNAVVYGRRAWRAMPAVEVALRPTGTSGTKKEARLRRDL